MENKETIEAALEDLEPSEEPTLCADCRYRSGNSYWSCAYIDIVGVSKRRAFPNARPGELSGLNGNPCVAYRSGEKRENPAKKISRLGKKQGKRSPEAQEKEYLRLYEGGISDRRIAALTNTPYSRVLTWRRKNGLPGVAKRGRPKKQ